MTDDEKKNLRYYVNNAGMKLPQRSPEEARNVFAIAFALTVIDKLAEAKWKLHDPETTFVLREFIARRHVTKGRAA